MDDGVIDPLSAAGIASDALDRSLEALRGATAQAKAAATSAVAAEAVRQIVAALLAAVGIDHRWTGTTLQLRLPDGSYGAAVDLKGGQGIPGTVPVIGIGTVGAGTPSVEAHVQDPARPILDFVLPPGWSPVFAGVNDGIRLVIQVVDWTGSTGSKPDVGQYIGATGFVSAIGDAVDLRGTSNGTVRHAGTPAATRLARFVDADTIEDAGATLSTFGQSVVAAGTAAALKTLLAIAVADVAGAQAALGFTPENIANRGIATGYAGLDATGKVPTAQLPASVVGDVQYVGAWNAATNTPAIPAAASGNKGQYYVVQVAGMTTIGGQSDWQVGDWLVSNGTSWDKIDNTDVVKSVAGLVGAISAAALKMALVITASDVPGVLASANNLSDLLSAAAARTNLGLGTAATRNVGTGAGTVAAGDDGRLAAAGASAAQTAYLLCLSM